MLNYWTLARIASWYTQWFNQGNHRGKRLELLLVFIWCDRNKENLFDRRSKKLEKVKHNKGPVPVFQLMGDITKSWCWLYGYFISLYLVKTYHYDFIDLVECILSCNKVFKTDIKSTCYVCMHILGIVLKTK